MATTKLLLLNPIDGLGKEGDVVTTKAGYARNFLLPKKFAIAFSKSNVKQIESLQKASKLREEKEMEKAKALSNQLRSLSLAVAVKTGEEGKLFGSVTATNIVERIKEEGIELQKSQIRLDHPIKDLGKHAFKVKLQKDFFVDLKIEVVSENPIGKEDAPEA